MGGLTVASRKGYWNGAILALCAHASGCIFHGGDVDPVQHPGPPVGITVLRVPVEKLVVPVPPPPGFSSTYQKMMVNRQRLARKKAEADAQARTSGTNRKDADSAARTVPPPA
jgi:hypothetical protein